MELLPDYLENAQVKQEAYPPKVTFPHQGVNWSCLIADQEAAHTASAAARAQKPAQTAAPAQTKVAQMTGHQKQAALAALAAVAAQADLLRVRALAGVGKAGGGHAPMQTATLRRRRWRRWRRWRRGQRRRRR